MKRIDEQETVIPVVEEEIVTGTRKVQTGAVQVRKHVQSHVEKIDMPLISENVEIRRVTINRVVTEAPQVKRDGDTIIVPIVEEELVITKRLVLREEVHLIRHRTQSQIVHEVELAREEAEVVRLDEHGREVAAPVGTAAKPRPRKRSLLED